MGHHFDSPESRADSRVNITENYVFHSPTPGHLIAVMCASPLAGLPSPLTGTLQSTTFRPGCAYDMRFDLDGDGRVDRILRFVFASDEAEAQGWEAFWLESEDARDHHGTGQSLGTGVMETTTPLPGLGRVWVGQAGDPFWLDAVAAKSFIDGLVAGLIPFAPDALSTGSPTTGATNVIAIVAEIGRDRLPAAPAIGYYTRCRPATMATGPRFSAAAVPTRRRRSWTPPRTPWPPTRATPTPTL